MKIKIRLLITLCALLPFIGQAITNVVCDLNGNKCDGGTGTTIGSVTRDMFYMVTLDETQEIDYFQNGWFGYGSDFIVINSNGVDQSWSINTFSASEPYKNSYVEHGLIASSSANTGVLRWQGGSISNGTYYFGYNTTQTQFWTVGFLATENGSTVMNENWSEAVGQGVGPIHAPIPEPASVLMLSLGGVLIGLFRRLYSHHA